MPRPGYGAGLEGKPRGLRCRQGLAPNAPRRPSRSLLHGGATHAASGSAGRHAREKVKTTCPDATASHPLDLVNRNFTADRTNQLWVADFTFVSTWQGFAYVAFIVDVFSRFIVGWWVSRHMRTDFVLDALEQALHARQPGRKRLIHHSDRGSQYVSIRYSERLGEAGIDPSVGSTGDSYDNAMAKTINGLYKAELVRQHGLWKSIEALELKTLHWVTWFNHTRLLEPIGNIPPAEFKALYERDQKESCKAA